MDDNARASLVVIGLVVAWEMVVDIGWLARELTMMFTGRE